MANEETKYPRTAGRENKENLELARQAMVEGPSRNKVAELRKEPCLEDCDKGYANHERDRWDDTSCLLRATEVFASQEKALRWLKKPCRALGGMIPEKLIETPGGVEAVLDEFVKIEHGVFS